MKIKKLVVFLAFCFMLQNLIAEEWYVCLASFKSKDNAESYCVLLEKNELPSWIFFSSTSKGDFYRVLYDVPKDTVEDARKLRDVIASSKGAKALKLEGLWICSAKKEGKKTVIQDAAKQQSVVKTPAVQEPVKQKQKQEPVKKESGKQESEKQEPVEIKSVEKESEKQESAISEPVIQEAVENESEKTEPVVQEPVEQEPVKQEAEKQETAITEPVAPEPVIQESAKQESVIKEPVAEEELDLTILTVNKEENNIVSEEKPYSVYIQSYKEELPAIYDKKRLEKNNINAYVLKTFDEESYFTFDLHAGAFEKEEDAELLIEQLEKLGIEDTEVSEYDDIKDYLEQYNSIVDSTAVTYSMGNYEIPDSFSKPIQRIIADFPINQNFQLEKIEIYDIDNIRKNYGTTADFKTVDNLLIYKGLSFYTNALSRSEYWDSLYNKEFVYTIATGSESCYKDMQTKLADNSNAVYVPLNVNNQKYDSWYVINADESILLEGFPKSLDSVVMLETSDFTKNEFEAFLNDFSNDSSLLLYPQIRKNLLTLPKKNSDKERDFIQFSLTQVDESYAQMKNYKEWSIPIVGHWNADTIFYQDAKAICVDFFDLDYDFNAQKIHEMFMDSHYEESLGSSNHPIDIKGLAGWYIENEPTNEVSFTKSVYIIAVNSLQDKSFTEAELIDFANELQIWDDEELKGKVIFDDAK